MDREIIGDCVNCERPVERNTPYEVVTNSDGDDDKGLLCSFCSTQYDDDELAEKDIIRCEY